MTAKIKTISMLNPEVENEYSYKNRFYKMGGAAALIVGTLFLVAVIDLILTVLQPGALNGWLSPFQNNWLVVIFKLHAGFTEIRSNLLYQRNLVDIIILVLIATMFLGLYFALKGSSKTLSFIALAQPILGSMLFIATKNAGRSGVMGAELVISIVMVRRELFHKRIAYLGMLSAILLLAGDLGVSMAPSIILAILTGFGYTLLVIWIFLVAGRLFQLGLDDRGITKLTGATLLQREKWLLYSAYSLGGWIKNMVIRS